MEISCTPTGVHAGTSFSVIEGKALEYALIQHERDGLEWLRGRLQERDEELEQVRYAVARASLGIRSRR